MIKDKYKKLLIISFVIVFSIMSVMMAIMSDSLLHTEHCEITNCSICNLINISSDFMKKLRLINIDALILIIIVPLIYLINENIQKERTVTLVEAKVIQNK